MQESKSDVILGEGHGPDHSHNLASLTVSGNETTVTAWEGCGHEGNPGKTSVQFWMMEGRERSLRGRMAQPPELHGVGGEIEASIGDPVDPSITRVLVVVGADACD